MKKKTIIIGSDHAGYLMKEKIKKYLIKNGYSVIDKGTYDEKPADYPLYAEKVCFEVIKRRVKGILICGSGIGMSIAANKIKGIRAAVAYDEYTAEMSRKHNNANVLALRARGFSEKKNIRIVRKWLNTPFSNEQRHRRRLNEIKKLEQKVVS